MTLTVIGLTACALCGWGLSVEVPLMLAEQQGPRTVTEDELVKHGDSPPEGLIAYDAPRLIETGVVKRKNNVPSHRFILAQVGNRRVFVFAPYTHSGNRLVGYLHVMDRGDRFHTDGLSLLDYQGLDEVTGKHPDRPLAPYYFEVTGGRRTAWVKVLICGALFLLGVLLVGSGLFGRT